MRHTLGIAIASTAMLISSAVLSSPIVSRSKEADPVRSPGGFGIVFVRTYVIDESTPVTSVMVSFRGGCTLYPLTLGAYDAEVTVAWLSSTELVIEYPSNLPVIDSNWPHDETCDSINYGIDVVPRG